MLEELPATQAVPERLLTSRQAAEILNCCEKQLWVLRRAGRLRAVHIGQGAKGVRFTPADLRAFVSASKDATIAGEVQP